MRRCAPVGGLLQSLDTAPRRRRLGARRLDRQAGPSQEHGCKGVLYEQTDHDGRADDGEKRDQQRARQPTPAPAPARPSAHPRSPSQGEPAPLLAALTCSRLAQRMFRYLLSICIDTLSARYCLLDPGQTELSSSACSPSDRTFNCSSPIPTKQAGLVELETAPYCSAGLLSLHHELLDSFRSCFDVRWLDACPTSRQPSGCNRSIGRSYDGARRPAI